MADNHELDRETLRVLQAQSGSHEALDELFKSIQVPLFRYIVSLVKERQLAEDILQEVFMRIYRKLRWLREPRAFKAWTYQIATREAFRYLQREKRWSEQLEDHETVSVEVPVQEFSRELIASVPNMIERLSPASRAVITLYYLHDLSLDETAAVLSVPLGTVKSRLSYGLNALRKQIDNSEVNRNEKA